MAKKSSGAGRRANPFRGFMDFMSEMNRAQNEFMLQHSGESARSGGAHSHAYIPAADIFAEGNTLYIRCEVPGVRLGDVSVTLANGVLTIAGERQSELDENKISYYARERSYGDFRRDMLLPEGVRSSDITARTHNGLLEVVVNGGASAKTDEINISDESDS